MKFCSDGGIWDPVWDKDNHNFGQCFVDVFLLGVPVVYLFLSGILTIFFLFKSRSGKRGSYHEITSKSINITADEDENDINVWDLPKMTWTSYELLELCVCFLLSVLPVGEYVSLMAEGSFEDAYGSQILTMILTSFSWIFTAFLLYLAKRRQPLGPAWWGLPLFLTLMFLANSCKLYYDLRLLAFDGWTTSFTWYFIYFVFLTAECLLGIFFRQPSLDTAKRYRLSREQASSFFSVLTFSWLNPILELGSERPLQPGDIWDLAEDNQCKNINHSFKRYWDDEMQLPIEQRSLVRALRKAHGLPFMLGGFLKLAHDLIMFTGPLLLSQLIQFIGDPEEPAWKGYAICFSIFATNLAQTAFLHQYFQKCFLVGMVLRSSTIAATYEKSLSLSISARQGQTQGAIVNLMAVDAQRFQDLMPYLHMLWSAPLQMGLALYFLYRVLGPSIFAGFVLMIIMIPLNAVISKKMKTFQVRQMGIKDTRLKVLNEILNGIKVIKLYAWERSFLNKIGIIRDNELSSLRDASLIKTVATFLWTTTPTFVSVVTFATFVGFGGDLTPAKAFTSISLFNILRFPTNALPMVITSVVEASVSVQRLRDFLCLEELDPNSVSRPSRDLYQPYCEVKNGSFSWSVVSEKKEKDTAEMEVETDGEKEKEKEEKRVTLSNVNLIAKRGELVAVIGKVGCGKTSFISACLGEIPKLSGVVTVCGSVAYAPQQAWIQNATLRDNITFGRPFELDKYMSVLEACALEADIAMLPAGDMTQVGEKGITLSGGQKQRLSLARSVYQDLDVYLLDDPLSAVDAHVGRHIFDRVIGPKGVLKDKVRILVTHAEQYLPQCDTIYVMTDGTFSMNGTYQDLVKGGHQFADTLASVKKEGKEEEETPEEISEESLQKAHSSLKFSSDGALVAISSEPVSEKKDKDDDGKGVPIEGTEETESVGFGKPLVVVDEDGKGEGDEGEKEEEKEEAKVKAKGGEKDKLIQDETRETGKVEWAVYWEYFKSLGRLNSLLIFVSFCLQQACQIGAQLWLARWAAISADENASNHTAMNLGIYSALSIISSCGVLLRSIALLYGSLKSSRNLHSGMIDTVTHAPMSFFDTTPLGRIVNRFSKDIYTIDETLPGIIGMWMSAMFYTVSIVIIILIPLPYYIVILIPVAFLFFYIQKFYLRSSREVQRVDSISRSPIYGHFGETLNGVSTVRSYSRSSSFIDQNHKLVDENQKAYFLNMTSNRWLAVRLETVGTLIVSTTALFSVISDEVFWSPEKAAIHSSMVGLAVSSALSMTQTLNWAVRMNCQMETNIVSVERIKEYTELQREAPPISDTRPPLDWPKDGRIDFSNVQIRYREGLDLVLKGVSLSVGKHEKLGIVGRTGAGKSTITLGLFRLVELAGGAIRIDGLDISKFGLEDLRSALAIIPQDPVLFSGTLRENLDPFNQHDDREIWEALERSHLSDFVKSQELRENMVITENGENLSVGQRQLVCMARALLRRSPILVMDEATAAVDYHTDSLIQETIRSEFKHCTVLTIAHRLNTIMDYDRILVLGRGKLLELGSPHDLMANPRSHLARMVADANKAHEK